MFGLSGRWTVWLAASTCVLYFGAAGISQVLLVINGDPTFWDSLASSLVWFLFPVVGALIAARQPKNAVGWILCALGLLTVVDDVSAQYARYALFTAPGSVPAGEIMVWLQSWLWALTFGLMAFLLLLFPNGKLLSRRWRPTAWVTTAASALLAVGMAFNPGPVGNHQIFRDVPNPFGLQGLPGDIAQGLGMADFVVLNVCVLVAATSMVVRFRRASGVERQQMKWFAVAAGGLAAAFIVNFAYQFVADLGALQRVAWLAAYAFVALAIGIAILKHRLYDIDLLINRSLVYGALTAGLGLVYWASVVLLQRLLQPFTQGSELAIVASTVTVATIFSPARRRIQTAVDHRFYRRKYDAVKTLESFSARLRQEVDLGNLSADLLSVVRDSVQPAHASLWLRQPRGTRQ